ncbi:thioredoxin family protein [Novosphingobium sp. FKTRR1]|uniref:thioredoxin family protein n=1 Tax=unclassified Novosphingobium TaxID=2644732 RepID=UPI001CF00591|nr:thioredoxin family protein [Novosphingobium sp. FKTRR1]
MRKTFIKALAATAALALAWPVAAAVAPRLPIASFEQLPKPLPLPYDESANADAVVAAAKARAKRSHKLLLIDLGGNWCLDCRLLAGTVEQEPLKGWLDKRFELVTVDVGRFDKNLQIQRGYGITGRLEGVPSVLVVDPRTNRLINKGHVSALSDARSMTPQALADWFAQWAK